MRADGPGRLGVLATDDADDSYDLSWMSDLPIDELRAIKMLRQLLKREADAIDRHYMHAHLQTLLYRSEMCSSQPWRSTTKHATSTTPRWTASGSP